jgi:predicted permease
MLLARTVAREHEIAVRAALGAGRLRLARDFFAEALVLCGAGALGGVVLASWGIELVAALGGGPLPRISAIDIDWATLGVAVALALGAAALLSVVAAWRAPGHASLQASRRTIAGGGRATPREALVAAQVALALVLVVGGALLGRSFYRLGNVDPGFETDGIVFMTLTLPYPQDAADRPRLAQAYERIIDGLRVLPGIEAVGGVSALPLGGGGTNGQFLKQNRAGEVPDFEAYAAIAKDSERTGYAEWRIASEDYFAAVGIPLLRGRMFAESDAPGAVHAALVSRSLAEREWPDQDPLGKLVNFAGMDGDLTPFEIVGIVGDVRDRVDATPRDTIYAYYRQRPGGHLAEFSIALRASNPTALIAPAREVVRRLQPDVPPEFVAAEEVFSRTLAQRRFNLVMLGTFGAAALVLAVAGLYGAIAFSVVQRTHEIGIRIALGAQSRRVVAMVVKRTLAIAGVGVAAGLVAAFGGARIVATLLYDVSPYDPAAYVIAVVVLLLAAAFASWLPAARAARVTPVTALRHD